MEKPPIILGGVKQNNLKNLNVSFPSHKITVVTGVSGSGKSSLAFDTLYAEGQRRYIESLSTYTRQFIKQMPKPDVDDIFNIPPAIALEQRNPVITTRSSVGTQTEIYDYLRVLYAKVGKSFCLKCNSEIKIMNPESILNWTKKTLINKKIYLLAPLTGSAKRQNTILQLLREQGFSRILFQSKKTYKTLSLEDPNDVKSIPAGAISKNILYIIVDRIKIPAKFDESKQTRLLDSIEQAFRLGHGNISFFDLEEEILKSFTDTFSCIECGYTHPTSEPQLFSFNNPIGACDNCSGFGYNLELDESLLVPDPTKTLKNGAIDPFTKPSATEWEKALFRFSERHGISIGKRYSELTLSQKKLLWEGDPKDKSFNGILACFEELKKWKYKIHVRVFIRRYQSQVICPKCNGNRLNPHALKVLIDNKNIAQISALPIKDTYTWFKELKFSEHDKKIATDVIEQIDKRLSFLNAVGVGYLSLSRPTKTLSGGEYQRINLATQLGSGLCDTLYVLDEPSIGLHAADTKRLITVLEDLRQQGNTVVIVEHDLEVMNAADHIIELGPGAGRNGGELIAQGSKNEIIKTKGSLTGKYLSGAFELPRTNKPRPTPSRKSLRITGCKTHNLKNIDVEIPLNRFVVVTGVSGSGKSTLIHHTLYPALKKLFYPDSTNTPGVFERIYGAENISDVLLLDQSSIGKNSRSNPATYLKAWDEIRRIFANQVHSIRNGYSPKYFSFNVDGGRCQVCKGEGEITFDMHFMDSVKIPCEECDGKRFKAQILDVTYKNKNIYQILQTTIDEAFELFAENPILRKKLSLLREVGLGYLRLGQSSTTLSGGESQRLKIASTLDNESRRNLLYLFDEPTTGLHLDDIKKLLVVLQDLVESGHSLLLIEHHLDIIAQADWIIDLGPEGGEAGGHLIASGSPSEILKNPNSQTGKIMTSLGYNFPGRHKVNW